MSESLFDKSLEYDAMLTEGLKLSGENKQYFMHGRIQDLKKHLPETFQPRQILDYGCGLGETSHALSQIFLDAKVLGVDTAPNAIEYANQHFQSPRVSFSALESLTTAGPFDLCYTSGVFHHIEPEKRLQVAGFIRSRMAAGGYFALFENNPWNPGTRLVMKRIAFDRDAQTMSFCETQKLLKQSGFASSESRFLFYFPRVLSFLRFLEPLGAKIPLGAQYYVLGKNS